MADRVSVTISIGGFLPQALLAEFVAAIGAEALTDPFGGHFTAASITGREPLELAANDVAGGQLETLERFCVDHQLPFHRWCGAYPGGWEAERLVYDGKGEARSYMVTDNDSVVVSEAGIRSLGTLEAITEHFRAANAVLPPLVIVADRQRPATAPLDLDSADDGVPTREMWRALIDFRARHGRYWKRALSLKWFNGSDDFEPFGSSLRMIRNLFGPSWLSALRPATLDAAQARLAVFDALPEMCATHRPGTGEPILIKRGETGYWPLPDGRSVDEINRLFEASPAQIAAMEAGSVFGWDVPGADPRRYAAREQLGRDGTGA